MNIKRIKSIKIKDKCGKIELKREKLCFRITNNWHVHSKRGGRMFKHENKRNGGTVACPIISEHTLGLRPSPTTPQFNKNKQ